MSPSASANYGKIPSLLFLLFVACTPGPAQTVQDTAYQHTLQQLLDARVPTCSVADLKNADAPVILDSRERREYDVSHMEKATWVGYNDFDMARVKDVPKNAPIVVYCSVGYRSERITQRLRKAGYSNVRNLYGGIFEWVNTGQQVVNEHGATNRIHGYDALWSKWLTRGEVIH